MYFQCCIQVVQALNEYVTPAEDDRFDEFQITESIPSDGKFGCKYIYVQLVGYKTTFEPAYDKTNKNDSAPSEDSDQPGLAPSLIRVFAVRLMGS